MRLAHISDTHLGYTRYNRVVPETGVNQREQDLYDAFARAVDGILAQEPDFVVHTGDLFDSPRPSNRAMYHAVRQLHRIGERGIPVVLISGNHSTPRLRATGSLFALLGEFVPGVHAVYSSRYERLTLNGVTFHAVPHCSTQEELEAQAAQIAPDPTARFNVALFHVGIAGFREFRMSEANEQMLPALQLPEGMDYIALGHYHKHVRAAERAWYAGSIERLDFGEVNDTKGFAIVDLGDTDPVPHFHEIPVRPMLDLEPVDATNLDAFDLLGRMEQRVRTRDISGAMVRLRVQNCPPATQENLDFRPLRNLVADALYFHLHWRRADQEATTEEVEQRAFESLEREWGRFMETADVHGRDRAGLTRQGLEHLRAGEEESDAPDISGD